MVAATYTEKQIMRKNAVARLHVIDHVLTVPNYLTLFMYEFYSKIEKMKCAVFFPSSAAVDLRMCEFSYSFFFRFCENEKKSSSFSYSYS